MDPTEKESGQSSPAHIQGADSADWSQRYASRGTLSFNSKGNGSNHGPQGQRQQQPNQSRSFPGHNGNGPRDQGRSGIQRDAGSIMFTGRQDSVGSGLQQNGTTQQHARSETNQRQSQQQQQHEGSVSHVNSNGPRPSGNRNGSTDANGLTQSKGTSAHFQAPSQASTDTSLPPSTLLFDLSQQKHQRPSTYASSESLGAVYQRSALASNVPREPLQKPAAPPAWGSKPINFSPAPPAATSSANFSASSQHSQPNHNSPSGQASNASSSSSAASSMNGPRKQLAAGSSRAGTVRPPTQASGPAPQEAIFTPLAGKMPASRPAQPPKGVIQPPATTVPSAGSPTAPVPSSPDTSATPASPGVTLVSPALATAAALAPPVSVEGQSLPKQDTSSHVFSMSQPAKTQSTGDVSTPIGPPPAASSPPHTSPVRTAASNGNSTSDHVSSITTADSPALESSPVSVLHTSPSPVSIPAVSSSASPPSPGPTAAATSPSAKPGDSVAVQTAAATSVDVKPTAIAPPTSAWGNRLPAAIKAPATSAAPLRASSQSSIPPVVPGASSAATGRNSSSGGIKHELHNNRGNQQQHQQQQGPHHNDNRTGQRPAQAFAQQQHQLQGGRPSHPSSDQHFLRSQQQKQSRGDTVQHHQQQPQQHVIQQQQETHGKPPSPLQAQAHGQVPPGFASTSGQQQSAASVSVEQDPTLASLEPLCEPTDSTGTSKGSSPVAPASSIDPECNDSAVAIPVMASAQPQPVPASLDSPTKSVSKALQQPTDAVSPNAPVSSSATSPSFNPLSHEPVGSAATSASETSPAPHLPANHTAVPPHHPASPPGFPTTPTLPASTTNIKIERPVHSTSHASNGNSPQSPSAATPQASPSTPTPPLETTTLAATVSVQSASNSPASEDSSPAAVPFSSPESAPAADMPLKQAPHSATSTDDAAAPAQQTIPADSAETVATAGHPDTPEAAPVAAGAKSWASLAAAKMTAPVLPLASRAVATSQSASGGAQTHPHQLAPGVQASQAPGQRLGKGGKGIKGSPKATAPAGFEQAVSPLAHTLHVRVPTVSIDTTHGAQSARSPHAPSSSGSPHAGSTSAPPRQQQQRTSNSSNNNGSGSQQQPQPQQKRAPRNSGPGQNGGRGSSQGAGGQGNEHTQQQQQSQASPQQQGQNTPSVGDGWQAVAGSRHQTNQSNHLNNQNHISHANSTHNGGPRNHPQQQQQPRSALPRQNSNSHQIGSGVSNPRHHSVETVPTGYQTQQRGAANISSAAAPPSVASVLATEHAPDPVVTTQPAPQQHAPSIHTPTAVETTLHQPETVTSVQNTASMPSQQVPCAAITEPASVPEPQQCLPHNEPETHVAVQDLVSAVSATSSNNPATTVGVAGDETAAAVQPTISAAVELSMETPAPVLTPEDACVSEAAEIPLSVASALIAVASASTPAALDFGSAVQATLAKTHDFLAAMTAKVSANMAVGNGDAAELPLSEKVAVVAVVASIAAAVIVTAAAITPATQVPISESAAAETEPAVPTSVPVQAVPAPSVTLSAVEPAVSVAAAAAPTTAAAPSASPKVAAALVAPPAAAPQAPSTKPASKRPLSKQSSTVSTSSSSVTPAAPTVAPVLPAAEPKPLTKKQVAAAKAAEELALKQAKEEEAKKELAEKNARREALYRKHEEEEKLAEAVASGAAVAAPVEDGEWADVHGKPKKSKEVVIPLVVVPQQQHSQQQQRGNQQQQRSVGGPRQQQHVGHQQGGEQSHDSQMAAARIKAAKGGGAGGQSSGWVGTGPRPSKAGGGGGGPVGHHAASSSHSESTSEHAAAHATAEHEHAPITPHPIRTSSSDLGKKHSSKTGRVSAEPTGSPLSPSSESSAREGSLSHAAAHGTSKPATPPASVSPKQATTERDATPFPSTPGQASDPTEAQGSKTKNGKNLSSVSTDSVSSRATQSSGPSAIAIAVAESAEALAASAAAAAAATAAAAEKEREVKQAAAERTAELLRALCVSPEEGQTAAAAAAAGGRLLPRGLVNTGNSCFVNSTLQALMSCPQFCKVLTQLQSLAPSLDAHVSPTLHGLALFANEFCGNGNGGRASTPPGAAAAVQASSNGNASASTSSASPAASAGANGPPPLGAGISGWSEVGKSGKRVKGSLPPFSSSGPSGSQTGSNAVLQMGGRAFAPSMLNDVVRTFAPRHAQAPASAGAKSSMAQKLAVSSSSARQEQEDAQEFLQFLIDNVHEEIMGVRKGLTAAATAAGSTTASSGSLALTSSSDASAAPADDWSQVGRKNKSTVTRQVGLPQGEAGPSAGEGGSSNSLMSTIFRGAFKSVVKTSSSKPSATIQPFTMLQLDIHSDNVNTVEAALQLSMTAESIDFKPDGASEVVPATKFVSLYRLPEVLLLHLKRFTYTPAGFASKLHKAITFDSVLRLKRPQLSDDCPDCRGSAEYKLMATVSHHGRNISGGHYTADVLQPDNTWLHFNDAVVEPISEATMLAEKPYIMFYQRQH